MISYPINLPARAPARLVIRARSIVGLQPSPFTLEHTVYAWSGDGWEMDVELPPMALAHAASWIAFLLKLNGMEGTFLAGQAGYSAPRGSWSGSSPQVLGAHAAGVKTVNVQLASPFSQALEGDWIQFGSGSSSRLHAVVQDVTFDSGGAGALEIWPATRAALANGDAITLASPKGRWRLASNAREWSIDVAQIYGLRFSCIEARD